MKIISSKSLISLCTFLSGGKVRFAILSIIIVKLSIVLAILTYRCKIIDTTVFSSALVVIATLTPFLYRLLVFVPVLDVRLRKEPDITKPIIGVFIKEDNIWVEFGYLRLEVVNYGLIAAKNCVTKVCVLERPHKDNKECEAPSREYNTFVSLTWSNGLKEACNIPPGANAFINVIIMPLTEDKKARFESEWHGQKEFGPLIAWFARPEVVKYGYRIPPSQDGLVEGPYSVKIAVFGGNSKPIIRMFNLWISPEWRDVNLCKI